MSTNTMYRHGVLVGNWQQEQYGLQIVNNPSTSTTNTLQSQSHTHSEYIYDHKYKQAQQQLQQARLVPYSGETTFCSKLVLQHDQSTDTNRFDTTYNNTFNNTDSLTVQCDKKTVAPTHAYQTETKSAYNSDKVTQTQTSDWRLHGRKPDLEKQINSAYHKLNLRK